MCSTDKTIDIIDVQIIEQLGTSICADKNIWELFVTRDTNICGCIRSGWIGHPWLYSTVRFPNVNYCRCYTMALCVHCNTALWNISQGLLCIPWTLFDCMGDRNRRPYNDQVAWRTTLGKMIDSVVDYNLDVLRILCPSHLILISGYVLFMVDSERFWVLNQCETNFTCVGLNLLMGVMIYSMLIYISECAGDIKDFAA